MLDSPELLNRFALANACFGADVEGYCSAIGKGVLSPVETFAHYCRAGWDACPDLFPFLDPAFYAKQLAQSSPSIPIPDGVTPFEHYMMVGSTSDLSPTPLFNPRFVRSQGYEYSDIFDYLSKVGDTAPDPHPLFSRTYYNSVHTDVAVAAVDPFVHFVRVGWRERRAIHPFFRTAEYTRLGFPTDCNRTEFNRHFGSAYESSALADAQPLFDVSIYLRSLGAQKEVVNPLCHFLTSGGRDGCAFPLFDQTYYLGQLSGNREVFNPYIDYLSDFSHAHAPCSLFDPDFYLRSAAVHSQFKGSLLEHFVLIGAAAGARPHCRVAITSAPPSRHSGFTPVMAFRDASNRQAWLCEPAVDVGLASQIDEVSAIEPALNVSLLEAYDLPEFSCPLDAYDRSLVAAAAKCARCNCLVVADSALDESWISRLVCPPAALVSCTRPWLTLISAEPPAIRYWHALHGCKTEMAVLLPSNPGGKVEFFFQLLISSIPNRVVVKTDRVGVALLRSHGSQIAATVPELVLLLIVEGLASEDLQFLAEYLATNYLEPRALIFGNDLALDLITRSGLDRRGDEPFVIGI